MMTKLTALTLAVLLAIAIGFPGPSFAASLSIHTHQPMIAALPGFAQIFSGSRPNNLGVKDGKLAACPASPNCVSSQAADGDAEHKIAPLSFTTDPANAMTQLVNVVKNMERTQIIESRDDYLYAEFSTRLMGFIDDVEFYLDPAAKVIHVRSASRLGQSDLGLNRKRVEEIRQKFSAIA